MVAPVFTDEDLEALRRFPEIGREELFRFFTLTPADVAFIDPGRGRGPADRLALDLDPARGRGAADPAAQVSAQTDAIAQLVTRLGGRCVTDVAPGVGATSTSCSPRRCPGANCATWPGPWPCASPRSTSRR